MFKNLSRTGKSPLELRYGRRNTTTTFVCHALVGRCTVTHKELLYGKTQIFLLCGCYFKNTKNLFIHIALIPEGDNPRVNPNILKCLLHSPVAKGYRLVVIASRAMVCKTPTYYLILNSLAFARGCVILRSHILFPLLLILLISYHI